MAHWAEIDDNGWVLRVLVTDNQDPNGDEGYQWLVENLGGNWVQTSYNSKIRKNFASVGFRYDNKLDAFIPPQPYSSWILNTDTCQWEPPVALPNDGFSYIWDDKAIKWVRLTTVAEG